MNQIETAIAALSEWLEMYEEVGGKAANDKRRTVNRELRALKRAAEHAVNQAALDAEPGAEREALSRIASPMWLITGGRNGFDPRLAQQTLDRLRALQS